MVNSPLIRPYFLGGWHWGAPLSSHCILGERPNINKLQKTRGNFSVGETRIQKPTLDLTTAVPNKGDNPGGDWNLGWGGGEPKTYHFGHCAFPSFFPIFRSLSFLLLLSPPITAKMQQHGKTIQVASWQEITHQ